MKLRRKLICTALAVSTLAGLPLTAALAVGNVKLVFNSNPQTIALSRIAPATTNGINYLPNTSEKFLRLRLAEPLLCGEFPSSTTSNVRLRMLDANGDVIANNNSSGFANTFGGLSAVSGATGGIRYQTDVSGDHRLYINTNGDLVCYTFSTFVTPTVAAKGGKAESTISYTLAPVTGNVVANGAAPDTVFADGFESPFVAPLDVVTTLSAPATVRADQSYVYSIRVRNTGGTAVSNVVVRDFFYKQASTSNVEAVVFQNGTWTCAAGAGGSCGSVTSGTGVIFASDVSLSAGGEVTYTATRPIVQTVNGPDVGAQFSVAAAAITNPLAGESSTANNSASATGTIVVTQPPVLTGLPTAAQALLEDASASTLNFTLSDPDTAVTAVTVTAASNNTNLVSNSNAVIGGSGASRSLTVTPTANANGNVAITVTANDGTGNTDVETVNYVVTPVNDAPSFSFSSGCLVKAGSWNPTLDPPEFVFPAGNQDSESCANFTVPVFGPADESGQTFASTPSTAVIVTNNSNSALFAQQPRFSTATNLLEFRPNGSSGTADITVQIRDNGGTANGGVDLSAARVFRVRVQGAIPTMSTVSDQTLNEDANTGALAVTLADTDTPTTSLLLSASSNNTALIPNGNVVLGGSGANRTVTITPLADQFGSAVITLTVSDGAQQSTQAINVTVNPINDPPSFANLGDQSLSSGVTSGLKTVSGWANNISVGPSNESSQVVDSFFVEVLSQTPGGGFLSGAPQVTNAGNLRFSLANNGSGLAVDGFACLRVTLFDNGLDTPPPNNNASNSVTFKVQVGPGSFSCAGAVASKVKADAKR